MNKTWLLFSAATVLYVCLFGASYLADPLGQVPVLDGRENLAWAQWLRDGNLPEEPLYRALLYPLVLSWFPAASLPAAATVLGLLLHLVGAVFVGLISFRLWAYRPAAWVSGLVYAVYPVALYFAGQVLDMTMATTLFLAGVYVLLCAVEPKRSDVARAAHINWFALLAGVLGGLAVLARPNFLPAVFCFPVVLFFARSRGWTGSALVGLGLVLMLGLQGVVNLKLSGELRFLPWQGAYNLYAANREGANGKYYTQQLAFDQVPTGSNTTRMESEWLYREAVGADVPSSIDAMNAFWRARLVEEVTADPLRWLGLMGRKAVYVFNNWEQYNNLTYAYHKARWPVLAWNPLGWGWLLLVATLGLALGFREASRPALCSIALLGLAYAAGLLLFFVSARFRLPLVPLLCVATGGCAFWLHHVFTRRQWGLLIAGLIGLSFVSFGNWFEAKDRVTYIQDDFLLARASSQTGDDGRALELARAVLARDPERTDARRLVVTSLFNLWLVTREPLYWYDLEDELGALESGDAAVDFIRGVVHWRGLRPERAVSIWESAVDTYGMEAQSSVDALQAVGQMTVDSQRRASIEQLRSILGIE